MILLRLLVVFIFTALLTGCMIEDLKSDVKAVKVYLRSLPAPGQCRAPGEQESSKSCYYKLVMTEPDPRDRAKGLFSGKIAPEVYTDSLRFCKRVNESILPKYKSLEYDCPSDISYYPDKDIVYTFHVDGDTSGLTAGQQADLESVPGSKHLRKRPP